MKKVKTTELMDSSLDWAVAKCEGRDIDGLEANNMWVWETDHLTGERERVVLFRPTHNWAQGGPIIEREHISTEWSSLWDCWTARDLRNAAFSFTGLTPLIAAMRCYVAAKMGDTIEIPKELLT